GAVFGPGRAPERPLRIGSVKGSIGHLEGAAGIAGVIKVCLMLKHRAIPPSLGFREPNPHIAFDDLGLKVQTTLEPWPDDGRPAVAGVSAFGWVGTNCHVVLEEHPSRRAELVTLAADGPAAVRRMAEALRERAADGQRDLAALRADAAVLSTLGSHRLAVVADSAGDLVRRLDAYLVGASMPGVRVGSAERAHGPLVFVYSPQGSQWLGMGRGLIAAEPVFKAVLERCDRVVRDEAGWWLLEELSADPAHSRLDEVDVVQLLISCVQMALTELWRSWGVVPDVVVGHSLGEVAAAYAAGILDLEDAVRLICVYSRMQTRPECRGGKAIINLPADDAARLVEPYGGRVVVAGLNGPASTLLSGDADALDEVVAACAARSVFAARVQVNVAVHNPRFESVVADMTAALSWLRPRSARIPMVSTVDARAIAGPECRGEYWARNLRQPVLFWPVIRELLATGHRAFVEVSPHGILTHALKQAFEHEGVAGLCVPTLRRGDDERASMLDTLGALYVEGRTITINGTRADGG